MTPEMGPGMGMEQESAGEWEEVGSMLDSRSSTDGATQEWLKGNPKPSEEARIMRQIVGEGDSKEINHKWS